MSHIQTHIDLIAKHEQEFLSRRSKVECFTDTVAESIGSLFFVVAHLCVYGTWILLNTFLLGHPFDPRPFGLLQTCCAMEAILISSFILMRQSRLGRRSDERDHLMLQILILTEKEITAALEMERQMAIDMGLHHEANRPGVRELAKETSIDDVAQTIRESLPDN